MVAKKAKSSPKKGKYMKYGVVSAVLVGVVHWVAHTYLAAAGDIMVPGTLAALTAGWYTWYVMKKR